ncbi:MAG: NUDIX hydrolase [Magnetococcus sp. MYC-9]
MRVKATVSAHALLVEQRQGQAQRVLMVRLAYQDHRWRKWSFPGGFVDEGEEVEAALLREVQEEIGVRLLQWQRVAALPMLDQEHPNISFIFLCHAWEGEIVCRSRELLEAVWMDREAFERIVQGDGLAYSVMRRQVACLGWEEAVSDLEGSRACCV